MWNPQSSDFSTWLSNTFKKKEEQGMLVLPLVLTDLKDRAAEGKKKYDNSYRVYTRDDPLWEAYEEALDLVMYLRAAIEQRRDE